MSDDLVKRLRDLGDYALFQPYMHGIAADRIEALEAERGALAEKLEKATRFVRGFACRAKTQDHGPDEMGLIDLDTLRFQRDCDIVEALATLAQITGGKTDE